MVNYAEIFTRLPRSNHINQKNCFILISWSATIPKSLKGMMLWGLFHGRLIFIMEIHIAIKMFICIVIQLRVLKLGKTTQISIWRLLCLDRYLGYGVMHYNPEYSVGTNYSLMTYILAFDTQAPMLAQNLKDIMLPCDEIWIYRCMVKT